MAATRRTALLGVCAVLQQAAGGLADLTGQACE
eukprot:COSAG02_NODE_50876_length_317_cov_1.880734_1_plen_32_part_01